MEKSAVALLVAEATAAVGQMRWEGAACFALSCFLVSQRSLVRVGASESVFQVRLPGHTSSQPRKP